MNVLPRLKARLDGLGIDRIVVVSPHLDDAVLSLGGFLRLPDLPERRVLTVFTAAGPLTDAGYAQATGFDTAQAEYAARRAEDERAMRRLGLAVEHCGLDAGRHDDAAEAMLADRVLRAVGRGTLVLLPLGAGAHLPPAWRFLFRILRRPAGAPPHGEHLWVRDRLRDRLAAQPVVVGHYAEVPYQWANGLRGLARLAARADPAGTLFEMRPDVAAKYAVTAEYRSQLEIILGRRERYRLRGLRIPERIWLPPPPDPVR